MMHYTQVYILKQGTGLQGQAIFRNKLSFRPHSTESFTHQKMTRQMAGRTSREQGIKVISQVKLMINTMVLLLIWLPILYTLVMLVSMACAS